MSKIKSKKSVANNKFYRKKYSEKYNVKKIIKELEEEELKRIIQMVGIKKFKKFI